MPDLPERYDQWCKFSHGHEMMKAATGLWVLYTELDKMERRAIAAEAEVANLRRHFEHRARGIDPLAEHLRAEADQLRADLAALVPVVAGVLNGGMIAYDELTAARAVLDRLAKEGDSTTQGSSHAQ